MAAKCSDEQPAKVLDFHCDQRPSFTARWRMAYGKVVEAHTFDLALLLRSRIPQHGRVVSLISHQPAAAARSVEL